MGGEGPLNSTEEYDGTSWSAGGNLATGRNAPAAAGTQSVGLCMGGDISSYLSSTEEYTHPGGYDELFTPSQGL